MKMTGAAILVNELIRQGTDIVFGYPGGYVLNIYDELYKQRDKLRHILPVSEQGGAFAADAYARITGKPSVVIATGGPGATNLVTPIACAYLDSVPVVYITGNVAVPMLGQDSFQDIDIVGVTMPIVKHSYVVKNIKDLQPIIYQAFQIASSGRKGPVHIDIPKDVQLDTFTFNPDLKLPDLESVNIETNGIDEAVRLIGISKKPFIYCGGGVSATDTGEYIIKLSKLIGAPVGMSLMGIGSVPCSYELNLGLGGMHGRYASIATMSEADLIIAAGVRFSDRATGSASKYAKDTSIIHIDVDAAEIGKNIRPDVSICADLRDALPKLLDALGCTSYDLSATAEWRNKAVLLKEQDDNYNAADFTPRSIISCVNNLYDDSIVVTTDVGQHQMWAAQFYKFEKTRSLITSGGLGTMGYGLGAAIGACLSRNKARTVLFTGDGSFAMNLTELATAVSLKLPITIILMNNSSLGMVRQWQTLFLDKRYSNTDINRLTDFPALASAYGAVGHKVNSVSELECAVREAPDDKPCLIECRVGIDEMVLPMIPPGSDISDIIM